LTPFIAGGRGSESILAGDRGAGLLREELADAMLLTGSPDVAGARLKHIPRPHTKSTPDIRSQVDHRQNRTSKGPTSGRLVRLNICRVDGPPFWYLHRN
jgi:hypothetical protein